VRSNSCIYLIVNNSSKDSRQIFPAACRFGSGAYRGFSSWDAICSSDVHFGDGAGDEEAAGGFGADFVYADAGCAFEEDETVGTGLEGGEVGDDFFDAAKAGEGEAAFGEELAFAFGVGMLHGDDDVAGGGDEVHGAAHALDHFAGDLPVGDIAGFADFHGAQDGKVDLAGADHAKAFGGIEKGGAGDRGDGLLTGVDEIGIHFALGRVRSDPEESVFALEDNGHACRNIVGDEGGDADAEVDIHAVAEFAGNAFGDAEFIERHG
jgi:hypothetical protein